MKRRGFTLIELLVVIAIIGILAAMLFPVFARARESARKVQCLANVKNIAMAMNMYGADWDAFPPSETRQEVIDFVGSHMSSAGSVYTARYRVNPYIRPAVVLDEYIKNRSIWNCPSATVYCMPTLIFGDPDWFGELVNGWSTMPSDTWGWAGALGYPYPNGWGGDVTDSFIQGKLPDTSSAAGGSAAARLFTTSIGFNLADDRHGYRLANIDDTSTYIICADNGLTPESMNLSQVAFPDMCHADCAGYYGDTYTPGAYPTMCDWHWYYDQKAMKSHGSRHLGGVNVGFLDGHAQWYDSMALVKKYGEVCTDEPNCNPCPEDVGDGVWGATSYGLGIGMWGPSSKFPIVWSCCDGAFVPLDQPWPPMLF